MATFTGKVRGGSLNMRQTCSTSATRLTSIPDGTTLTVQTVSGQNDWFQTSYSGKTGYVVAQYIAVTTGVNTCTVTTQSDPLNIRKTPSTSASAIYTAAKGSILYLLDSTSVTGWFRVSSSSGTGWASKSFLTINSTGGGSDIGSYPITATVDTAKHGNGGTLNLRQNATTGSTLVTTIPNGATIHVNSLSGEWLAAKYNAYTGYVMAKFIVGTSAYGESTGTTTPGSLTVDQYITNLESFCNNGWSYGSGYKPNDKIIDCAWYPYKARNDQGAHGCTTEYNSHLSEKGRISSYDNLVRGMEIFQPNANDPSTKEHMGVYAGKVVIAGVLQHAVYQSCSSHNTIDAKYNNGVTDDSGPNLTGMNNKWKYWGWSKYVKHD